MGPSGEGGDRDWYRHATTVVVRIDELTGAGRLLAVGD